MRKYIFFLLGLLISFLFWIPSLYAQSFNDCYNPEDGRHYAAIGKISMRTYTSSYSASQARIFCESRGWTFDSTAGHRTNGIYCQGFENGEFLVSTRANLAYNYGRTEYWSYDPEIIGTGCYGYTPTPQDPSHCSNYIKDGDESGIDCGGSCNRECDAKICPENWVYNSFFDRCEKQNVAGDAYNNCKPGWEPVKNIDGSIFYDSNNRVSCKYVGESPEPIWVNSGDYAGLPAPDDPMPEINGSMTGGFFSVTEFVYPETVTDNGDGTFTHTTTTVITASNGTSSTTTTNTIKDGAGNVISSNTVTTGELAPEDNPGNYTYGFEFGGNVYDTDIGDDMPKETDGGALLTGWLAESPFLGVLNGAQITTENAICLLTVDVFGTTLRFDFCQWEPQLAAAGQFFVGLSTFAAGLVVFRGWGAK